jgi:hypothetical protein
MILEKQMTGVYYCITYIYIYIYIHNVASSAIQQKQIEPEEILGLHIDCLSAYDAAILALTVRSSPIFCVHPPGLAPTNPLFPVM